MNAASQKAYRGINTLLLWAAAQKRQYESSEWATYRQWQDLGGQVRKGQRSTLIVFWKFFDSNMCRCTGKGNLFPLRRCHYGSDDGRLHAAIGGVAATAPSAGSNFPIVPASQLSCRFFEEQNGAGDLGHQFGIE